MSDLLVSEQDLERLGYLIDTQEQYLRLAGTVHGQIDELLAKMKLSQRPGAPAGPTLYNQRDQRWSPRPLGKSTKYSIGSSGCLITSYASCLTDAGMSMNPDQLNDWLKENNGFLPDAEGQVVNFVFSRPNLLGVLKFDKLAQYNGPAPMEYIEKYIADGGYVIVKVDFNSKTRAVEQHWVRYLGDGKIMDPWYGDTGNIVSRYIGKTVAEAIWAAAYYKKTQPVG